VKLFGIKEFFAPIKTEEEASKALSIIGKAYYTIGAIQAAMYLIVFASSPENRWGGALGAIDGAIYFMAGYFLPRYKSRGLAWLMLLLSVVVVVLTIAAHAGAYSGGKNIGLALIVLGLSYRGVRATLVYHKRSQTIWKNVSVVGAITLFVLAVVMIFSFLIIILLNPSWETSMSDDTLGFYILVLGLITGVLCFLVLPKKFPMVTREAIPIAES
jgi:hypothetical protein